jgi:hypothetical protein
MYFYTALPTQPNLRLLAVGSANILVDESRTPDWGAIVKRKDLRLRLVIYGRD